ncbi:hypothetical protein [Arthrobacter crystallopoietes]|jgi:hypothetical protein|uniref:hypothetical protein n=1 Tax=Crystallibacter crystallopoietes TaxID=37928 RepID=UPI00111140D2|nr:hypothetical protein [Arthrobacter crystallopoietes]QTG81273.1 hypothetical protein J5251_01125 [Arthrobacter crystallopoietes]
MNERLAEAIAILGDVEADDASNDARGRRAHARVIAMIEFADEVSGMRREQRIANLLTLAQMDKKDSKTALEEARRLLELDTASRVLKTAA